MKRITQKAALLIAVIAVMAECLCGCQSSRLASCYDEAKVKEAAQTAAEYLIHEEYDQLIGVMDQTMKDQVTVDQLKDITSQLDEKAGKFQSWKSAAVAGQRQDGADYAVTTLVAVYDNAKITFTIAFNQAMEIAGLHIK